VGTYGAEPILLDFYLNNAPPHVLGKDDAVIDDWQVRATIDGQSFTFDRWEPIYLKGFKKGKNWVKLELLEDDGDAIPNVFNSTAHLIDFQPNGQDTLSRLLSGEKIANIDAIANPDYVPPAPEVVPTPVEIIPAPVVAPPAVKAPANSPANGATPEKAKESPKVVVPTVIPSAAPAPKKEEVKPINKAVQSTNSVTTIPVVPVKSTPEAIAPIKVKAVPVAPIKVEPIKVEPVKVAPAVESVKVTPIKVNPAPVVVEPVKPVITKVKTAPVAEPTKVIAPKSTPAAAQTTPKPEPVKPEPAKDNKAPEVKSTTLKLRDYFNRKVAPKPESTNPEEKVKSEAEPKAASK
jgi:hypothetical protein